VLERTHRSHHGKCAGQDALGLNADSINGTAIAVHSSTCIVSLACKYIRSRSVIYRHYVVRCHYSCLAYSICPSVCLQYNMMLLNGSSLHTSTLGFQVRLVTICFQLVFMAVLQGVIDDSGVLGRDAAKLCEWLQTVENISHSDTTSHPTRPKFSSFRVVC
jgi:hypothetical protein